MTETDNLGGSAVERLQALGVELLGVGENAMYGDHRSVESSIQVAGQLPYKDGELLGEGILGRDRGTVGSRSRWSAPLSRT